MSSRRRLSQQLTENHHRHVVREGELASGAADAAGARERADRADEALAVERARAAELNAALAAEKVVAGSGLAAAAAVEAERGALRKRLDELARQKASGGLCWVSQYASFLVLWSNIFAAEGFTHTCPVGDVAFAPGRR